MEQAGGDNGNSGNTHTTVVEVPSPKAHSFVQSLRHSFPTIGSRGRDSAAAVTAAAPPTLLHKKLPWGGGGNRETAAGAPHLSQGPEGGAKGSGESRWRGGGSGRDSGRSPSRGGTTDASAAAAVAAAVAELSAAALAASGPAAETSPAKPSVGAQAEEHLSCKYTKEELLARHWGMNLVQMKRVKALLRMGVCEEDLEIANRLLKMGRDMSQDTPLTKEEQLLGYTSQQRQRIKALQILGLTEESFDRCRAVMLSSLGPSAFGYTPDETAKSAARAEAEEGWTPGDKFRRKGPGHGGGGDGSGSLLRMPTFGSNNNSPLLGVGNFGGQGSARKFGHLGGSGRVVQPTRRASDSDKEGYLPDVLATKRKGRGAAAVAVAMPPLETIVGSRLNSPAEFASPLSTSSDPR